MQKLPWKTITAYFVAKCFVVLAWAPSTRSSSSLTSRHAKRCCSSFFCFLSTGQRERDGQSPNQNLEKFLHLNCLIFVLESLDYRLWNGFKHRKRDVATVFSYSHLNTPIDQWECAYCLKYFIKIHRNRRKERRRRHLGNRASLVTRLARLPGRILLSVKT